MHGIDPERVWNDGTTHRYECLVCGRRLEQRTTPVECAVCGGMVRNLNVSYGE